MSGSGGARCPVDITAFLSTVLREAARAAVEWILAADIAGGAK